MIRPALQGAAAGSGFSPDELFSALFESSDNAIIAKTLDGTIRAWNEGATVMYGYSEADAIGQPVSMLCPPDRKTEINDLLERLAQGERIVHHESVRRRKNGDIFPVSVSIWPIHDAGGKIVGASSLARDLSAQQRARHELQRANRNLKSLIYSMAHDLRTPLRSLAGFSAALADDYADVLGETGRGYTGRIVAASQHMSDVLDSLACLSRISQTETSLQPVDLGAETAAIAAELQRQDPDRRVTFTIQQPAWALADPALIRIVLSSLLGNAWKFTAGRDVAVIEFGMNPAADARVSCYVRDNGAGFDPAYVDKLFTPFQRLHAAREFPGIGIGLAGVRLIVDLHGGRTWAAGTVGHGATFSFDLQAAELTTHPTDD